MPFPTIQEAFGILREQRPEQVRFAMLVDACIRERQNATIEAGTGTGKSLGYLLPIVSQGRKAVITTGTIALQEQLVDKDLPFTQRQAANSWGIRFKFAMLKGASNYLCNRRFDELQASLPGPIAEWGEATPTGDLGQAPEMDYSVKDAIRVDRDDCGRQQCPFWSECYHQKAKERAKEADVLVIVHAMVCQGLGEPYGFDFAGFDVLIVDEAHQFEDYARGAFEGRLSPTRLSRFIKAVESTLIDARNEERWKAVIDPFRAAWRNVIAPWMPKHHSDGRPFDDEKLLVDIHYIREQCAPAVEALEPVCSFIAAQVEESDPEHMKIQRQLDGIRGFFQELASGDAIAVAERKLADDQKFAMVTMATFPLNVGERLARSLYPTLPVIFTSATISANGDFSMVKQALALDPAAPEAEIGSPFDYPRQALLYVPRDARFEGKAANPRHAAAAREEIETLVKLSRGRAFVLFTSNKAMREAFQARRHPYPSRWQEPDSNKNALIQWFKDTPGAVLYATASFWEGVSIEGEALSLVIIDKIPFPPPNDPIFKAKEAKVPGGKGFFRLSVPSAIIKLKQGFGRLVRTQTDRGMVAILDSRIHSGWGKQILTALPPACLITDLSDRETIAEYLSGPLPAAAPALRPAPAALVSCTYCGEPGCDLCNAPPDEEYLDSGTAMALDYGHPSAALLVPNLFRETHGEAALQQALGNTSAPDPAFWQDLAAWEAAG